MSTVQRESGDIVQTWYADLERHHVPTKYIKKPEMFTEMLSSKGILCDNFREELFGKLKIVANLRKCKNSSQFGTCFRTFWVGMGFFERFNIQVYLFHTMDRF